MELVVFVGLQASGKSTFFRERFAATHEHVSKDLLRNNKNRNRRQAQLVREALEAGRSVVVDNTNPTVEDREPLIRLGREPGARVVGYYFESSARESLARNKRRDGRTRVPDVAVHATAKKLVPPSYAEGFDELFVVRIAGAPHGESDFEVRAWPDKGVLEAWSSRPAGTMVLRHLGDGGGARMASTGKEILGEHYGADHLTYEQIEGLGLRVVTEDGETMGAEEVRGRIFRIVDPDEPSGYVVKNTETTGQSTTLSYLQRAE